MSLLADLNRILEPLKIPVETGVFSDEPPEEYLVITPMLDRLDLFADDQSHMVLSEARLSLFTRRNYIKRKKELTKALQTGGMTITDRRYVGYENDSKYHHYAIDVMKEYETEDE
ncbi:hypothetical protein EAL2_c05940 [Peptoclostridium acidaminophilum DSM 3953]|uniref:Uncharacterized protein n=1 Tax=Peptoclostridium acidaminophilum DSM 3953 TaxID=1286171 RepID=W8U4L0_PEPAC|nr:hypothetical protein [Peptoclostridium acidaminophilum]AHM55896.1 hypothetical protein EAL2_c05940 [Peptoclostridium acidaminophilum DSM 3953]